MSATTAAVNVAAEVCRLAPQIIPSGTPAGEVEGLVCPLVAEPSTMVGVLVSAAGWRAIRAEAAHRAELDAGH